MVGQQKKQMKENAKKKVEKIYWRLVMGRLDGVGIIEVILILVIIIGLVLIFRKQIMSIMETAFNSITSDSSEITEKVTIE